jgi:hypothetical protein
MLTKIEDAATGLAKFSLRTETNTSENVSINKALGNCVTYSRLPINRSTLR